MTPKKTPDAKPKTPRVMPPRIKVNEVQRDLLLGAVKREAASILGQRDAPESIRMIALREVRDLENQLENLFTATA